jgi:hypothetical protein
VKPSSYIIVNRNERKKKEAKLLSSFSLYTKIDFDFLSSKNNNKQDHLFPFL